MQPSQASKDTSQASKTIYRPFETVPPELLSQILSFAWLSYAGENSLPRFLFPSALSEVDRFFNQTVNSTSILWSYLRVTSVTDMAHIQERIHHRSGRHQLEVCLIFEDMTGLEAQEIVQGTIMQSPSRFVAITILHRYPGALPGPEFWNYINLLGRDEPLRAVRFSIHARSWAPRLQFLPPFTSSIRSLGLHCRFNWLQMSFPNTLIALSIDEGSNETISTLKIFQCLNGSLSQSLRSLTLVGIFMEYPLDGMGDSCVFGSLEYLGLEFFFLWEVLTLLHIIHPPYLRHLFLEKISDCPLRGALKTAWDNLRFPELRQLTVYRFSPGEARLAELTSNLPDSCQLRR